MAAISFRGSPPAAPTRRPGDIAKSPVVGCAPGGPRSNPDARSDARPSDVLSIRDAVARISSSSGSVVRAPARDALGSLGGFLRRPATTCRRWARGRAIGDRRWRVAARRRREPPPSAASVSARPRRNPSSASRRLSPCPFLSLSRSAFASLRFPRAPRVATTAAGGPPRCERRRRANYPILCVRRSPPRPSLGASTRAPRVASRLPPVAPACARGTSGRVLRAGVVSPPSRASTSRSSRVASPPPATTPRGDPRRRPRQPPRRETAPPPLAASWARPRRGRRARAR